MRWYKNITGAFSDTAILFPLLALLSAQNGASTVGLLLCAGIAYCVSGVLFRIPMPVQPLKSVVLAAVALGATAAEINLSAALIGVYCLLVVFLKWDRFASKVPLFLVHGLQVGLGVMMILKGVESLNSFSNLSLSSIFIYGLILTAILYITERKSFPLLGMIATLGLVWGVAFESRLPLHPILIQSSMAPMRLDLVALLVLPQLILTSANSVISTEIVAKEYFGEKAKRVTAKRLLFSIGFGNLVFAVFGGLPFCHGAGGLTAHVKGGSYHWISNWIIGLFLIALAGVEWWGQGSLGLQIPRPILSLLLVSVGLLHLRLAAVSWKNETINYKPALLFMALAALVTQNMLWVLVAGVCCLCLMHLSHKGVAKI